ncbi:MAG TPA: RraA family protein [Candidatus Binatia bacterium]|nr:RraA family protein [Candidatus Binatia bacterium]
MATSPELTEQDLHNLRQVGTTMVANAVERFNLRLRNTGFTHASVRCMFPDAPPMVGYAVTARLRTGEPPITGGTFRDRTELWKTILESPKPRVLVVQDVDTPPGRGAFLGNVHAAVLQAVGCIGCVTNGAVRELPAVRSSGVQVFAGNLVVSHAYAHIFEIGETVNVGGMEVRPGDLLHGDQNGVITIPHEIARDVPPLVSRLQEAERAVIEFCRSPSFSVEGLRQMMKPLF